MDNKAFSENDKINIIKLLNIVAKHASFNMNTQEIIEYHKLLNYAQMELLPKVEAHILEVKKLHKPVENKKPSKAAKKGGK